MKRKRNSEGKFEETKEKSYGNFLSYVNKSALVMNDRKIERQLRRCTNKLKKEIAKGKMHIAEGIDKIAIEQIKKIW